MCFVASIACDETKKKKGSSPLNRLNPGQAASWHVLVSSQRASWAIADNDEYTHRWLDLHRPPVSLSTPDGATIFHGLFRNRSTVHHNNYTDEAEKTAKYKCRHFDRDGAASNTKLLAVTCSQAQVDVALSHRVCVNHGNQAVETSVSATVNADMMSKFYSISLLLRMFGNFHRLIAAVDVMLADDTLVNVRRGQTPPGAISYGSEIKDYAIRAYKKVMKGRSGVEVDDSTDEENMKEHGIGVRRTQIRGLEMLWQVWTAFLFVFIGLPSEVVCHYRVNAACCGGHN